MNKIFEQIDRFDRSLQFKEGESFRIILPKKTNPAEKPCKMIVGESYTIKVKSYMVDHVESNFFDFQRKWNNNTPMPASTMQGTVLKDTRSAYKMDLQVGNDTWVGWIPKSAIVYQEWDVMSVFR